MWTGVHYWDLETIYQISHRLPQQRWLLLMRIVKRNLHMTKITRSQNVILNKHDSMLLNKFTKGGNQSSIYSGTCAIRHLSFPTIIWQIYTLYGCLIYIQWNLSNPTLQISREMCRMVQDDGILRNLSDGTVCCNTQKCVGWYRMSEYSGFILVNRTTLGP
jgi:hypothetical protein